MFVKSNTELKLPMEMPIPAFLLKTHFTGVWQNKRGQALNKIAFSQINRYTAVMGSLWRSSPPINQSKGS